MKEQVISGIYKITNIINNKVYIGESLDIYKRWEQHINDLNKNQHYNKMFQNHWNLLGKDKFKFSIIKEIKYENSLMQKMLLLAYESYYIEQYNSIETGYNIENTYEKIMNLEKGIFKNRCLDKYAKVVMKLKQYIIQNNGNYIHPQKEKEKSIIGKYNTSGIRQLKDINKENIKNLIIICKQYKFQSEYEQLNYILYNIGFNMVKTNIILREEGIDIKQQINQKEFYKLLKIIIIRIIKTKENILTRDLLRKIKKM